MKMSMIIFKLFNRFYLHFICSVWSYDLLLFRMKIFNLNDLKIFNLNDFNIFKRNDFQYREGFLYIFI